MDLSRRLQSTALIFLVFILVIQSTHSRFHGTRHKRQNGARLYHPETNIIPLGEGTDPSEWGPWSSPSECSRSCGGGVAYQSRECLRYGINGAPICKGGNRKYFSCNTQDCPEEEPDFRAQQCSRFNNVPFDGVRYEWIPYTKAPNPCELNCMPRGERFYYRQKAKVIDGTRCNDQSLDVCVDGRCESVGCDMLLGSNQREDKCRKCAGDGKSCRTVSGVFDLANLQAGYNDILLVPAGATNINIREKSPSNNYFACRNASGHYYLNGNWKIEFPRPITFAGALWTYERHPQGFAAPDHLSCLGPINEAIFLVLLVQDRNVGVQYEYSVPENTIKATEQDTYSWTITAFGPCSVSCGGGFQTRNVTCNSRTSLEQVDNSLCDSTTKPADTQQCNQAECAPRWVEGPWEKCSKPCGPEGKQERKVHCERVSASGVAKEVKDTVCLEEAGNKPATIQECNIDSVCPKWHIGPWTPCNKLCGEGIQKRRAICYKEENKRKIILSDEECLEEKPESEQKCMLQPCEGVDWITSSWSGCAECGLAQETRTAICGSRSGKIYNETFCSTQKPELVRPCKSKPCQYIWFKSEWSACSAKCGKGVQTRIVLCGKFDGTSVLPAEDNSKCDNDKKPEISQECEAEIEKCPGQWFTGPWGECSKQCGGGERTREVICLVNHTKADTCLEKDLEFTSEKCNTDPCTDDELIPVDGTAKPLVPDDDEGEEECEDDDEEEEKDDDIYGVEVFARQVELKASTAIDFDKATTAESSLLTDDLMMSDATGFELTDVTGSDTTDIPSTVEGSGDETTFEGSGASDISTIEGGTDESGVTEDMLSTVKFTSVESSGPTSESSDVTGESGATEEDVTGVTSESGPTVLSSESATDVSGLSSDITGMTSESGPTALSSESATDVSSESPKDLTTSSGETMPSSDLSSAVTEDGLSSVSSEGSSDLTSVTPGLSTDLLSTEGSLSSVASSDLTDITGTDDQVTKTTDASPTSSDSSASTDPTDTTPTTDITPTSDTTESSSTESSSDTSGISSTESAISSTSLDLSSSSSSGLTDVTTESSDLTPTGSAVTTESGVTSSGSEVTSTGSDVTPAGSDVTPAGSDVTPAGSDVTPTGSEVTPTGDDASATTPDSVTGDSTVTSSDASGVTDITSESSDITTSSPMSEVTGTDLDVSTIEGSTEVTSSTEAGASQPSTESSEIGSSSSDVTTASGVSSSEEATTISGTDVTGATDEAQTKISDTTESVDLSSVDVTTVSGVEETTVDIWTTTSSSEDVSDLTTPNTIQAAVTKEQKPRKCKPKTKKVDCSKAGFGCCPDGVSVAKGPFDEGCPMIETCEDSKYGCCPDGLSPAKGKDNKGCPASLCAESLFGCCPDKFTPAEGEDNEGCPEPTTQAPTTEGDCDPGSPGCCPDGVTGLEGCASTVTGTDETTETDVSGETTESSIVEEPTTEGAAAACSSTTHGCCPDGETPAQGENFLGCDTEHESDCFNSLYGCCQDNRTAATGPNKQGCEPCLLEQFGCCPDNNTPAHGPNYEGCCLDAPYGCCPDNINSAQGPDYEGCDCKYSSYGCCPDNDTPARGPDMAGCGCQYSPHGCCPDKVTPAEGENFAGCPCHTFQFGCCPDGVTVPQGPHNYGCHCSQTEHKCCPDDTTAAKGPNFEGCTCAESKFGCCPDGVTEAKGKKFEGCVNVPEPIQKSCSLNKDSGPCTNYTINYFFDTAYGACVRFWYGGCEGNNNRFTTPEECNRTCEDYKGKEACLLPRSSGPCPGYHKKYYFDTDRNQCTEFNYGGCFGNTNRFDTLAECQRTCAVDESLLPCEQPVDAGPCQGNFERWYYDNVTDVCRPFTYGGCKGNKNNYATEHACNYHCKQPGVHRETCALPKQTGNCLERLARWYYSEIEEKCMPFYYTGCGGNKNNYISLEQCEQRCPKRVAKDTCELPAETGECQNYVAKWYYDTKESRCRQFYYGGCGGNGNNFDTETACEQRCTKRPETTTRAYPARPHEPEPDFRSEYCFERPDPGRCTNYEGRWYYNSDNGVCEQFTYGGCDGNPNKFYTEAECENNCGHVQSTCSLPPYYGRSCRDSNITRWYFDERTGRCHEFEFGGCSGNRNNFFSESECLRDCSSTQPEAPGTEVEDYCSEPSEPGNCNKYVPAWFYNKQRGSCEQFYYTGCGGNRNRFSSQEQCERQCGEYKGVDVCYEPLQVGGCDKWENRFYYDPHLRSCQEFAYSGCGGSGNRFASYDECKDICISRQEPLSPNTRAICYLPPEIGECNSNDQSVSSRRWFYDDSRETCVAFIYSGCSGNQNNFQSFESCLEFCRNGGSPQEPAPETIRTDSPDICETYNNECRDLRCPYGIRRFYSSDGCQRCECEDPCSGYNCPDGFSCAVDIADGGVDFTPTCRQKHKPGQCPALPQSSRCDRECYTDADCRGESKCCHDGCGYLCVPPAEVHAVTTTTYRPPPLVYPGNRPPFLEEKPQHELDVDTPSGGVATLRCFATGYPAPTISWKKGSVILNTNQGRYVINAKGDLTIVQVHRTDSGSYICIADNGLGTPVTREIKLVVTAAVPREAYIIGERNSTVVTHLGSPATLRCPSGGHPKPTVYWWRGKSRLPLKSNHFEVNRDYSLVFSGVRLTDLGVYTCEAWSGRGRPASIDITLKAYGPAHATNRDEEQYLPYIVDPPTAAPTTTLTTQYPYHPPTARRPPPVYPTVHTPPQRQEPVKVQLRQDEGNTFAVGSDVVLYCDVEGYPTPVVTWTKDDEPIQPSARKQIVENPHRLVIYGVTQADTGYYGCTGRNSHSYNTHKELFTINGIYIHPECLDNQFFADCSLIVKGRYCNTNAFYKKFCCRSCTLDGQLPNTHPNSLPYQT